MLFWGSANLNLTWCDYFIPRMKDRAGSRLLFSDFVLSVSIGYQHDFPPSLSVCWPDATILQWFIHEFEKYFPQTGVCRHTHASLIISNSDRLIWPTDDMHTASLQSLRGSTRVTNPAHSDFRSLANHSVPQTIYQAQHILSGRAPNSN